MLILICQDICFVGPLLPSGFLLQCISFIQYSLFQGDGGPLQTVLLLVSVCDPD